MEKRVQVLDCTLRDGGRIFDCAFEDKEIESISKGLSEANIDIIEIGFLGFKQIIEPRENSTFFNKIDEIKPFIIKKLNKKVKYVVFIQYELYDINNLQPGENSIIDGIRLGVCKVSIRESINSMQQIKEKGYRLFIQPINILEYSDEEIKELICILNDVKPYSVSIVDTYGAMYIKDLIRIYKLMDKNLNKEICINLHSHNNKQLSFALAITFIDISKNRNIIIDSTLSGIGMGAGNLSTELIIHYLNEQQIGYYKLDKIIDIVDNNIIKYKNEFKWETSILTFESAFKWVTQDYLGYIEKKYSHISLLNRKMLIDLLPSCTPGLFSKIDEDSAMMATINKNDYSIREKLKNELRDKKILIIARGHSVKENEKKIEDYINCNEIAIIFINAHQSKMFSNTKALRYYFCGNKLSYDLFIENNKNCDEKIIRLSNIESKKMNEYVLDYKTSVSFDGYTTNDSTIILLNLIMSFDKNREVFIAGFDGMEDDKQQIKVINALLSVLLQGNQNNTKISFLTRSVYGKFIKNQMSGDDKYE